jgi:glycosyltransferase involved in cell wall biosynthesis
VRLLRVISSVDSRGGGPIEGITQLQSPICALGHSVDVACLDEEHDASVRNASFPVHALGPARGGYRYAPRLLPWLKANAAAYDAIIVEGIWQYHSLAVWLALRRSSVPYFVFTHGMLDPWFRRTYPLKHLKKWLYWPWAEYRVLRDARAVIFTCEDEKFLARQSFLLYRCREEVANYGTAAPSLDFDRQVAAFFAAFPETAGRRILLFLSRIHPKKGCDNLVEAFAEVARADHSLTLVMAGPDQVGWTDALRTLARRLGVADRIIWPGMLSGDLKWGAFQAAEAFVLPSHQENFGIAVAEALACSKPVLISDKINIWREIDADAAGLIEDDTVEGTRRLLRRWLALQPAERAAMTHNARACFERRFSVDQAARSITDIVRRNI